MKLLALLFAIVLPLNAQTLTNTNLDGVTNATLNGKLDDDAAASRTALGLDTSTTGGANKIAKFDSLGNLKMSALIPFSAAGSQIANGGNLILTDRQSIGWYASDGNTNGSPSGYGENLFKISQNNNRTNETNIDARGNFCINWGNNFGNKQLQLGSGLGGQHYISLMGGEASSGNTTRNSVPVYARTHFWNGSAAVENYLGLQATVATNGKVGWRFYKNVNRAVASENAFSIGDEFADLSEEGLASPGQSPAYTYLTTGGATINQVCSKYRTVQTGRFTLDGNRALALSGVQAGMRGVIYVAQPSAGGPYTLTLPGGSSTQTGFSLSTTAETADRLGWEYDGTFYYWTIHKGFSVIYVASDADALAYIAAVETAKGSSMSGVQRGAIESFIMAEKAASRWALHKRIYLPIWGNSGANAIDIVTRATGSFPNGATHGSGFVQGNGVNQYFDFGVTPAALSLTNTDVSLTVLFKAVPTTAGIKNAVGCYSGAAFMSLATESSSSNFYGNYCTLNADSNSLTVQPGIWSYGRDATKWELVYNITGVPNYTYTRIGAAVGTVPTVNLRAMALSAAEQQSDAQLGAFSASRFLTSASAYTNNLKTLWQTCTGLTLP